MYSRFQLAKKFLHYYLTAANGKGHGIHSPFVFDFVKNVLNDKKQYPEYKKIELRRHELLKDSTVIQVDDHGAGSGVIRSVKRKVSRIAASSMKPEKYAQLLYRIVKYYQPKNVIELGTSFGISTAYMASASPVKVFTMEGSPEIADIASATFEQLRITNTELLRGPFDKTFGALLDRIGTPGLVFIDGNHKLEPTLRYFEQIIQKADEATVIIADDIHWSSEMEEAWSAIKRNPAVTLTIDLFFIGIIVLRKDFKAKQHFQIRF